MDSPGLSAIVLAAGDGSRMQSARPKPLHRLCGRPMVRFVLDAITELDPRRVVVVVGKDGQRVAKELADVDPVTDIVDQVSRGGTADAVRVGLAPLVDDDLSEDHHDDDVLIVPGDIPLVTGTALRALVTAHRASEVAATVLARSGASGSSGGRVVRSERDGSVERVSAADDLVGREREITEYATGIWCVRRPMLAPAIRRLQPDAETGEVSLAGIAEVLAATGNRVEAHLGPSGRDVVGVNDRVDLAAAEVALRSRINDAWLRRGVTMVDAARTYVDATVRLAPDVTIFPGVILQGATVVGEGTEIGPGTRLVDSRVGPRCRLDHTTAELATIGSDSRVGPYAVLTPGAEIPAATVTGPFYTAGADGP